MSTPRPTTKNARKARSTLRAETLDRIRTLVAVLTQSARAVERSTGITNAQLFLLQQLASAPSLSVSDLAARARTQLSTISIVIARLVRAGLAAKQRSSEDRRMAHITITPKGRRLLRHAPTPPTSALLRAIERLSDRDARALSGGVRALLDTLDLEPTVTTMLFEHAPTRRSTPARPGRTVTRSPQRKP
ncbi:MAG TPA: MarR family transcriptional regulator [Gemmatimonadaceae bacterium]|nr:MarR family transcriptional regulator [Gemmatimonadaceae bacterium]